MSLSKWLGSRQAWIESFGVVFLLLFAVLLAKNSSYLKRSEQVMLWALWLALLAVILRRHWTRLLGPVFFYDLIRSSRRGRQVILRCIYALALLVMLYSAYQEYRSRISRATIFPVGSYVGQPLDSALMAKELARFAESFFLTFMEVQFATVFLLTPVFAAGAIAEEKDRKTLEFILATDLTNREIVISKLASRLAQLSLIILTGLPILALTQFLGGIDPNLVLAGFAATGISMASIASLSILSSVYCKKPRDATILTYLFMGAYLGLAIIGLSLRKYWPSGSLLTAGGIVDCINAGNLFEVLAKLSESQKKGELLITVLPGLLWPYAGFHALVAVVCTIWAVARLRVEAMRESIVRPRAQRQPYHWRMKPAIGRQPMMWKEIFIEPGLAFNRLGKAVVLLIVVFSFVPAAWIAWKFWEQTMTFYNWPKLSEAINKWVRAVGTIVACLTLLGVALRAATSISGERDRQTLDSLMTSPLRSKAILSAKLLGSVLSIRWAWLWLCTIWGLGVCTGGLNVSNLPWLALGWIIYAGFFACLGMCFSSLAATSQRATMWTLTTTCLLQGLPWFSYMFCGFGHSFLFATTPPLALEWLAFRGDEVGSSYVGSSASPGFGQWVASSYVVWGDPWWEFMMIGFGFVCWTGAAFLLWKITVKRFQASTNRDPSLRRPQARFRFLARGQKKQLELTKNAS